MSSLALKSDLRVMFQDIKSIIKTNTETIKAVIEIQKYEEESKSFSQDIRILKDIIGSKAEARSIKDSIDLSLRLKADLMDLNKICTNLQSRMNSFDSVLHKENTDFKLSLLERKIKVMEERIYNPFEDKNVSLAVTTGLHNLPSPARRPLSSKHRVSLHDRAMSHQNS